MSIAPTIGFSTWDLAARSASWRAATPFPHVVIDDLFDEEQLAALRAAVAEEPHAQFQGEIYDHLASPEPMLHPTLRAFADGLGTAEALASVEKITGKASSRVEVRSYIYRAGQYLLPHADYRKDALREVAFAYYLTPADGCDGGDLELFDCTLADGQIATAVPSSLVAHRANRLVLFDVSLVSLHQVREVRRGARSSLAGWFLSAGSI